MGYGEIRVSGYLSSSPVVTSCVRGNARGNGSEKKVKLTARFIKEGITRPGRYSDDQTPGLYVFAQRRKTKAGKPRLTVSYVQRLTIYGVRRDIGLGSPKWMTLTEARAAAAANYRIARKGGDPLADRRKAKVPTFAEAAAVVLEHHRPTWSNAKHADDWIASLQRYVFPRLGNRPVDSVTTSNVLNVLLPIWHTRAETARRVRQRIGAVMKWAVAQGHRADNPAGEALDGVLPRNSGTKQHHRAIPHSRVADAVATVRASNALPQTKLLFEFAVLTGARSLEARAAEWNEIDLDTRTWTVPASRMKARIEHRVPLSDRAAEILDEARELRDGGALVFPGSRVGRPLSDMTLTKLFRETGIPATLHGFRSSFRDWCGDTGQSREVAEAALAHRLPNKTEAAYARSDLFERRRRLMNGWAAYLSCESASVVRLHV